MQPANSSFVSNATAAAPAQPSLADILLNDLSFTATLQFKRGETIFLNNQQANNIFIIKEGRVKLSNHSDDGREIIKAILISNEILANRPFTTAKCEMKLPRPSNKHNCM